MLLKPSQHLPSLSACAARWPRPNLLRLSVHLSMCACVCLSLSLFVSPSLSLPLPNTIERTIAAPHGHSGGPPELRPATAPARRAGGRRHQRLPDGAACRCPLWSLQGGQAHRRQEGQPKRQSSGRDEGLHGGRGPSGRSDIIQSINM